MLREIGDVKGMVMVNREKELSIIPSGESFFARAPVIVLASGRRMFRHSMPFGTWRVEGADELLYRKGYGRRVEGQVGRLSK